MSGCCGQGPVIVSGAATAPRVDVETVLLCDVLADGTVAGVALVEPIYDTNSGDRVGTRTVNPATGAPYAPTGTLQACAPDGCTATTTALVLCDTATDGTVTTFVRSTTYDCEGELIGTLDRTLAGAAYVPAGTVGVCPAVPDCESPTTPTATIGLCLPDGTPIAVTVIRNCQGVVTSEGWINLRTGAFSAGSPPVGTVACGDSQSVQVSGTFCDVDEDGAVVGLVLIEYSYAADGTIDAVRLVDATTGTTYVPAGEITTCPAGVSQPEQDLVQLCDVAADGTSTTFVRDYRRDELGAISGHTDYLLDGTAYVPTGAVGTCGAITCETLQLCDSSPAPAELGATALDDPSRWRNLACPTCPAVDNPTLQGGLQALFDGGSVTFPLPPTSSSTGSHHWAAGALTAAGCSCPDAEVTFTISVGFLNNGPANQQGGGTGLYLYDGGTLLDTDGTLAAAGTSDTLTVSGTVPLASIQAGSLVILFQVEGGQQGSQKTWTVSDFAIEATTDCGRSFLRTVCRDSSGTVVSETDTLDGTAAAAYTAVGDVQPCGGPETGCGGGSSDVCRNSSTVLLCDADPDCQAGGTLTATPEPNPSQFPNWVTGGWCLVQTPGQGAAVWSGGSVVLGPDPACPTSPTGDTMRTIGVRLKAGTPGATAPVPLTVSVRVTNNGPNAGVIGDGRFGLWNATTNTRLTRMDVQNSAPVGHQQTLTLTAPVPAADLAAGQIVAVLDVETYQGPGAKSWTIDEFAWSADVPQSECETQFLRTITVDCETGETVSVTDTTLDGSPYTVVGDVGQCQPTSGEDGTAEPCRNSSTVLVCDVPAESSSEITPTLVDSNVAAVGQAQFQNHSGPYTPLWSGGTFVYPAGTGPAQQHLAATGQLTADLDGCDGASGTLTISVRVRNDGPGTGQAWDGALRLFRGTTVLATHNALEWAPSGWQGTLMVSAPVTAAEITAGDIRVALMLETFHLDAKSWTADQFTASLELEVCETTTGTQFLRTLVTDCVSGDVVTTTDTTLDGDPYTVTGTVGQCAPTGGDSSDCRDCEQTVLCDVVDGAEPYSFLRTVCRDCTGSVISVLDTELDGVTAYGAGAVVADCGAIKDCPTTYASECWSLVKAQVSYDNTAGSTCGSISPNPPQCAGTWVISSWVIDGVEQVTTPVQFTANACGGNADQFHGAWAAVLATIDPSSSWEAAYNAVCLWYIRTTSVDPNRVYGQMLMHRTTEPGTVYTLGSAASRSETTFSKLFTQECDGTTTVSWTDENGNAVEEPEGDLTPCAAAGTLMSGPVSPTESGHAVQPLCDVAAAGTVTSFLRHWVVDTSTGLLSPLADTALDGVTAYAPTGTVRVCGQQSDGPALTGVRRVTSATTAQDLKGEFPGLQSVSLSVLAGSVNVAGSNGTSQAIPAGASLTWSVADTDDSSLAAASFAGVTTAADYFLVWTYKGTAAG